MGNCRWTGPLRRTRRFIWFNFSKMITKNAKTATMKKEHKQKHVFSILSTQLVNEFCWRLFWQLQKSTNARIISQYKKAQSGRSNSRALKNKRPHQHSDNFHERLSTNSILHSQLVQDPALNFLQHHQIPNSGQSLPQNLLNSLKFQKNKKKKIKKDKKKWKKLVSFSLSTLFLVFLLPLGFFEFCPHPGLRLGRVLQQTRLQRPDFQPDAFFSSFFDFFWRSGLKFHKLEISPHLPERVRADNRGKRANDDFMWHGRRGREFHGGFDVVGWIWDGEDGFGDWGWFLVHCAGGNSFSGMYGFLWVFFRAGL